MNSPAARFTSAVWHRYCSHRIDRVNYRKCGNLD